MKLSSEHLAARYGIETGKNARYALEHMAIGNGQRDVCWTAATDGKIAIVVSDKKTACEDIKSLIDKPVVKKLKKALPKRKKTDHRADVKVENDPFGKVKTVKLIFDDGETEDLPVRRRSGRVFPPIGDVLCADERDHDVKVCVDVELLSKVLKAARAANVETLQIGIEDNENPDGWNNRPIAILGQTGHGRRFEAALMPMGPVYPFGRLPKNES